MLREDLVIQKARLEELFSRLQDIGAGLAPWVTQLCAGPLNVFKRFSGARTIEEFFEDNDFDSVLDLPLHLDLAGEVLAYGDTSHLTLVAIYPSGALRSLRCQIAPSDEGLAVVLSNQLAFIDPDASQPLSNILSFWAQIILFAVKC